MPKVRPFEISVGMAASSSSGTSPGHIFCKAAETRFIALATEVYAILQQAPVPPAAV